MSTTIDQMIAAHIGQDTPLPSLEVASETTAQVAACPSGAGCYYSTTLSFRNATSPLPMEFNPRKVFTQLFGEGDTDAERAAIARADAQPARPDRGPHRGAAETGRRRRSRACSTST